MSTARRICNNHLDSAANTSRTPDSWRMNSPRASRGTTLDNKTTKAHSLCILNKRRLFDGNCGTKNNTSFA